MSSSTIRHRRHDHIRRSGFTQHRSGFTLVELLIGITIIGLLVGMLAFAGAGVIRTSREFAVNTEVVQMSQSIEGFKTKYGFYPPSFEQFSREATTNAQADLELTQFLPYLNKIAPNHQESTAQLRNWWLNVGVNLDQRSSLVFWLSGLPDNKQFPLSGFAAAVTPLNAYDDGTVDRQRLYDFDSERLQEVVDGSGVTLLNVRGYEMAHGKTNGDKLFVYRDAGSYVPGFFSAVMTPVPYDRTNMDHLSLAYHINDGSAIPPAANFLNPNTFQLICFGIDGDGGEPIDGTGAVDYALRGDVENQGVAAADNLCNFAGGRLDKFIDDLQQ